MCMWKSLSVLLSFGGIRCICSYCCRKPFGSWQITTCHCCHCQLPPWHCYSPHQPLWPLQSHHLQPCYDKGLTDRFLFIYSVYWYWSHSDSCFIFLPASGPIVLVDSCAACCCDSELRLTVHCCALWPIVAVTLLFLWRLLFALPYCSLTVYKSGLLGTL